MINDLGFKGLVITDALDMKAIVDFSKGDYPDVSALNAGNDLLLMPTDVAKSIKELKKAIQKNKISNKTLEKAVKKNLMTKYKKNKPTKAVIKWPKKTFFGWAKGLSEYPKSKTIDEPKEANKNIPRSVL